jgi:hypothetical protein
MNQSYFEGKEPSRLGRPPPATPHTAVEWQPNARRKNRRRGSAPARQEGSPPTFTIASPRLSEGEAMAKAGGQEEDFRFHHQRT